ncbi:Translation initiation factor IF-2 [Propionispora sp. 2/2-37]|uniref:translation initiation factor IF-2 n=1 Tax=Propionispora sp. 2/2-37 TaxID=1677858 RepID=UPI0006BB850B|nr:translation initiation factor IF-2 [Propionispora sp. 2/2-37]CUH96134.1 Translation initiation factor IF-2 [Propionispora sp. 2/2-37]
MSKYRIYELAKEFDTTSKVIIDILARNNITAKNHMSSVDHDAKQIIDRTFARKNDSPPTVPRGTSASVQQSKMTIQPAGARREQQAQPAASAVAEGKRTGQHHSSEYRQQSGANQRYFEHNRRSQPDNRQQRTHGNYPSRTQQVSGQSGLNRVPRQQTDGQQRVPRQQQQQQAANQHNQTEQNRQRTKRDSAAEQRTPNYSNRFQSQPSQRNQGPHGNFNSNKNRQHGSNRPQQNRQHAGKNHAQRHQQPSVQKVESPKPKLIKIGESIIVKELASKLGREAGEVIKKLMMLGVMVNINQEVDFDTASIIATDFGVAVEALPPEEDPTEIPEIEDDEKSLVLRPPVVTVMGHVDHGKTSLLDAIRKTRVTQQEAGGITQHIGAYQVNCQGKKIVFLDTPGHEAFTAMRARGAQVTDIAILVVAADDGVMPQTIEAINHAKSAKVPIIVAINKMDRPGANPDRVKQQLADHGLIPEDWGGDTIMVPVSAHQRTGIEELLEMILLVAEMQEIKANPNRAAYGIIIEAELDKGRGPVATVLVQKGTLRIGDSIIAGTAYGKVRAMVNDRGEKVKKAEPSTPVEVLGLADVPQAGDILAAVDEKVARAVAEKRVAKRRTEEMQQAQKVSLDDLFKQIQEGNIKDLNIVIKADVQGSIEALRQSLLGLNTNEEVRVSIVHAGVGAINESDVMLASASNALILGFNVRPDGNARKAAENEKVDIRTYRVIYEAINDVEAAMTGMLAPEYKEVVQGRLEVRKVISVPKTVVAGSYVLEGKVTNSSQVRIVRNGVVIHEGEIEALRRFKDDVKEVAAGYECGISVEKFRDIKEGDIIEAFIMEETKKS